MLPAASASTRTCEHPYAAARRRQSRSEGWHCRGRCKTKERHGGRPAGREERVLKRQMRYTRSGSIPVLNAAPTEAKELGSDGDPELPVPAETGHTQHTCNTSGKGY